MKTVILQRLETSDFGTFGTLTLEDLQLVSGELPWRNNKKQISCIPPGEYVCQLFKSERFDRYLYRLENVPNRNAILIHAANFCADITKGLKSDLNGCIGVGLEIGKIQGQKALKESKMALKLLHDKTKGDPFSLIIIDATNIGVIA